MIKEKGNSMQGGFGYDMQKGGVGNTNWHACGLRSLFWYDIDSKEALVLDKVPIILPSS